MVQRHFRLTFVSFFTAAALIVLLAALLPQISQADPLDGPLVEVMSNIDETCYALTPNPDPKVPTQAAEHYIDIAIPYAGTVEEAHLLLRSNNVRNAAGSLHPIRFNGVEIGTVTPDGRALDCAKSTSPVEYTIPIELVKPGVNRITLTTANTTDEWNAASIAVRVRGHNMKGGVFVNTKFAGENGQLVDAVILRPSNESTPRPLLLLFYGWKGKPIDPYLTGYTGPVSERDWYVASPQQRGNNALGPGGEPLASLRSQHDALKLIDYMRQNYHIDPDRIYVGGFSMGGEMAGVMAAKNPDIFAAAVTHKAIGSLKDWYNESEEWRQYRMITETGGTPAQVPFEYARRSPVELARNLKNLPIAIIHGNVDTVVKPHHATDLLNGVLATQPVHAEIQWYPGDHADEPDPYDGEWAVPFMAAYTRLQNPASLRLRTDESKAFYWLDIGKRSTNAFTEVSADVDAAADRASFSVKDSQSVDLTLDLARMGLDPQSSYVLSQTNSAAGTSFTAITPIGGKLALTAPNGNTKIDIFPNNGNLPVQLVLQRGSQGYTGAVDTWLNAWDANTIYGTATTINLRPNDVAKGLLRFDLTSVLPPHVDIVGANLKLYYDPGSNPPNMTVSFHRMLRSWSESSANYKLAAAGQPWSADGGAAGADWEATPTGAALSLVASEGAGWRSVNMLDAVKAWYANPAQNDGLALIVDSASFNGVNSLRSSDHWDTSTRPRLEIIYQTNSATPPTPTATRTPTATPTPSTTPSPTATATPSLGIVNGRVYEDVNNDMAYQAGEPGLSGAVLMLMKNGVKVAERTSDGTGLYDFSNLSAGSYTIVEKQPAGYNRAKPTDQLTISVSGGRVQTVNFGHQPLSTSTPTATPTLAPYRAYLPLTQR